MRIIRNVLLIALPILAVITGKADDTVAADKAKLQGTWMLVMGQRDGQAFPDDLRKTFKRVATNDEATVTAGEDLKLKAKFTIDPSKQPKTIDYLVTGGPYAGNSQLGIYEFDGDTVKFCFSVPGKSRPKSFSTKFNDGQTLTVWRQIKS